MSYDYERHRMYWYEHPEVMEDGEQYWVIEDADNRAITEPLPSQLAEDYINAMHVMAGLTI